VLPGPVLLRPVEEPVEVELEDVELFWVEAVELPVPVEEDWLDLLDCVEEDVLSLVLCGLVGLLVFKWIISNTTKTITTTRVIIPAIKRLRA